MRKINDMIHYNYQRRTSIDKFNNRPPFNIKKMDDATSTENKGTTAPLCNNCEKIYMNAAVQSYINVAKYLEQFSDKYPIAKNNKNKNVIPKIIESFQRINPKKTAMKIGYKKKSESLETLFRKNTPVLGKNVPKHRLMKNLLKDYQCEDALEKPSSCQQMDMIPSKDTSLIPSETEKNFEKLDKQTSTSGLQWPIVGSKENCQITNGKLKSKIPQRKGHKNELCKRQSRNTISRKTSTDSSDLEYFPTKERSLKKPDQMSKIPLQTIKIVNNLNKLVTNKEFPNYKYNTNSRQEGYKKENTYVLHPPKTEDSDQNMQIRKKEKSFVQLQIEKFNKRNINRNINCRRRPSTKCVKKTSDLRDKNKNMNSPYLSLMTSVKETLPKIEGNTTDSTSEHHEWSDNHVHPDMQVRFPKETCNAMEHLLKTSKRVPLTKYIKRQDFHIQPAISASYQANYKECSRTCQKKVCYSPCSKNLVCQGDNHNDHYSRPETDPLPLCTNKSKLRSKAKGTVK